MAGINLTAVAESMADAIASLSRVLDELSASQPSYKTYPNHHAHLADRKRGR